MEEGRPLKFESPELLQEKIKEYFDECEEKGKKPFITELAVYLDTSRQTLCNYEKKDGFFDTIKRAKEKCEMELERNLIEGKVNPTGSIFNLKNNYGWKDRNETDITTQGDKINGVIMLPQRHDGSLETSEETDSSSI